MDLELQLDVAVYTKITGNKFLHGAVPPEPGASAVASVNRRRRQLPLVAWMKIRLNSAVVLVQVWVAHRHDDDLVRHIFLLCACVSVLFWSVRLGF